MALGEAVVDWGLSSSKKGETGKEGVKVAARARDEEESELARRTVGLCSACGSAVERRAAWARKTRERQPSGAACVRLRLCCLLERPREKQAASVSDLALRAQGTSKSDAGRPLVGASHGPLAAKRCS